MRTVRPQGARIALGLGLALAVTGATAGPASANSLPAPEPVPVPIPAPVPDPAPAPSKTPGPSPSPGPARTLLLPRGDGQRIRVSWPSGHRSVAPASTVPVRVGQPGRGARKLTVSLLRVSAKGRILGTVQRTSVTSGTVSVAIPDAAGRRYALRLLRGGKLLRSLTIRTPPAAPVPTPVTPMPSGPVCAPGVPAGQIELEVPVVAAGLSLNFAVLNTGATCLSRIWTSRLERQDEHGAWQPAAQTDFARTTEYYTVPPGKRDRSTVGLPADAVPGTYRLLVTLETASSIRPATEQAEISATFMVTAAP